MVAHERQQVVAGDIEFHFLPGRPGSFLLKSPVVIDGRIGRLRASKDVHRLRFSFVPGRHNFQKRNVVELFEILDQRLFGGEIR